MEISGYLVRVSLREWENWHANTLQEKDRWNVLLAHPTRCWRAACAWSVLGRNTTILWRNSVKIATPIVEGALAQGNLVARLVHHRCISTNWTTNVYLVVRVTRKEHWLKSVASVIQKLVRETSRLHVNFCFRNVVHFIQAIFVSDACKNYPISSFEITREASKNCASVIRECFLLLNCLVEFYLIS